jgi:hypothetical protein
MKPMENPVLKTPKTEAGDDSAGLERVLAGWLAAYQGRWQSDPNRHEQTLSPIAKRRNTHQKHTQNSMRVNPKHGTSTAKQCFFFLSFSFGQKFFLGVF